MESKTVTELKKGQLTSRKFLQKLILSNYNTESGESLEKVLDKVLSPKMDFKTFNAMSSHELKQKVPEKLTGRIRHKSVLRDPKHNLILPDITSPRGSDAGLVS